MSRMDDEYGVILVENIDNLKEPTALPPAHDKEFVVANLLRKRGSRPANNRFRFFGFDPMLGDMSRFHSIQRNSIPDSKPRAFTLPLSPRQGYSTHSSLRATDIVFTHAKPKPP
jgi:hypothetical protein